MTEEEKKEIIEIIRDEFADLILTSKYTFQKDIQILDMRNIQLGRTTGTKIGTVADQKLGLWGVAPVVQQTGIAAQKINYTAGDLDSEAEIITAINTTNTAINALRTALNNLGITTIV